MDIEALAALDWDYRQGSSIREYSSFVSNVYAATDVHGFEFQVEESQFTRDFVNGVEQDYSVLVNKDGVNVVQFGGEKAEAVYNVAKEAYETARNDKRQDVRAEFEYIYGEVEE